MTDKAIKTTKKDQYYSLLNLISDAQEAGIIGPDEASAFTIFINKEVEALDRKAENARKRAAKKKSEGDELREALFDLLTDEPQTIPDLLPKIQEVMDDETISAQKIAPRLRQLVDSQRVDKSEIAVSDAEGERSRKLMGYSLHNEVIAEPSVAN